MKDDVKENVKAMDVEAHRDLRLLEAVHEDSRVTQRGMAKKLGIALGLANIYLKRMIHKGYIKCVNVQPNRLSYLITPRGIAEKARLTYEFMDYSLHLYGEVRQHLREAMQDCAAAGKRVAIYGSGEAAELALQRARFRAQARDLLLHLAPVLLGGGARLFDGVGPAVPRFEVTQVLESPRVTHLRYRAVPA